MFVYNVIFCKKKKKKDNSKMNMGEILKYIA